MPSLNFEVPNPLGQQRGMAVIESFLPQVQERFKDMIKDMQQSVNGNLLEFSFKTMGLTMSGKMTVGEDKVHVAMDIPFAALMMKGKIQSEMTAALEKVLQSPR